MLVGAITTLIVTVSVFLAYSANKGLPFVPTYSLSATLPSASNLVEGNEVRVGGFRVGVVDRIGTTTKTVAGRNKAVAVIHMKLDKKIEPLSIDTGVLIRQRSALGLKYVQLTPGTSRTTFKPGDTIPLTQASLPVEFDDFLNTFDQGLRDDSRTSLQGYGDALAGRGESINLALQELPRFFGSLSRVMDALNDESTQLDQFFLQIGRAAAQVAPVDETQAQLFTNMADTFEAFSRDPAALQATIEEAPLTLQAGIESFPVQRPFLADFAELSNRLRPAVQELPRSLPVINSALVEGQQVLPRTVRFNRRTEDVLAAVDRLAENPSTLLGLRDLDTLVDVTGPLVQHVGPYQTVCNYANFFFNPLGEHQSEITPGGTIQRIIVKTDPGLESQQYNRFGAYGASRPADYPDAESPQEANGHYYAFHGQVYQSALDARGRADCQNGQNGFLDGPLNPPDAKYPPFSHYDNSPEPPNSEPTAEQVGGGSSTVLDPDIPYTSDGGRAGPTFDPNSPDGLGVESLRQVP